MSPKKCVFGCEGKITLFSFPKNPALKKQWMQFVVPELQKNCANSYVCSRHFGDKCFTNKAQFNAGFADRLKLRDGAVPTIKDPSHVSQPQASTSIRVPTIQDMPSFKNMACQTEHRPAEGHPYPQKISVGIQCTLAPSQNTAATQFSFSKQTGHVPSTGTQATVFYTIVSTETTQVEMMRHLSSTPISASTSGLSETPAKRPRIELVEENEDEESLSEIPQLHNSTYEPGVSVAEPSEISGMDSCDYTDAKYIIYESFLRELFKTCPLCKHNCDVQRRWLGAFVSFRQVCDHCQYTTTLFCNKKTEVH